MERFLFTPFVDLPLGGMTLAAFLWHFNRWAFRHEIDTHVDLTQRLPTACRRVIVLLASIVMLCWLGNIAFWSLFALTLIVGLGVVCLSGGDFEGIGLAPFTVAFIIREWAFGFPQFIIPPETHISATAKPENETASLVDKTGVTTSTLCPSGNAQIDGVVYSVVSENGQLVETGESVIVTCYRNRQPCVARSR